MKTTESNNEIDPCLIMPNTEQLLAISFLYGNYYTSIIERFTKEKCINSRNKQLFYDCFELVTIESMGEFKWRFTDGPNHVTVTNQDKNINESYCSLKTKLDFFKPPPSSDFLRSIKNMQTAQYYYLNNNFYQALLYFEKIPIENRKSEIWLNMGVAYLKLHQTYTKDQSLEKNKLISKEILQKVYEYWENASKNNEPISSIVNRNKKLIQNNYHIID